MAELEAKQVLWGSAVQPAEKIWANAKADVGFRVWGLGFRVRGLGFGV